MDDRRNRPPSIVEGRVLELWHSFEQTSPGVNQPAGIAQPCGRGVMTSATERDQDEPGNVADLLRAAATRFPDRPAVIFTGGERSWAELDRAVDNGVRAVRAAGLEAGDRVLVSLPTGADIIAGLFAISRSGLVAVPLGPHADLQAIARKVGARGAITDRIGLTVDVLLSPENVVSWWSGDGEPAVTFGGGEDIAVLARAASSEHAVMVSHRAILAAVRAVGQAPRLKLRPEDRAIAVLPTYHLAGWVTAVLPLCEVGAAVVVPDTPGDDTSWVQAVLATVRRHRVTVVPGAPSLYRRLRGAAGVERALSSVRLMTSGAAPLDPGDSSAIRAMTAQSVWEGYGISESSSVVSTSLMTRAARAGSVGLAVPGLRIRVVGDDGSDLYAEDPGEVQAAPVEAEDISAAAGSGGEVGRIQISGPTLFSGYWPDGAGGVGPDGWFTTGDLGYLDDAGELHLVDRAAETIRVAGFTVYPREIEDLLTGHPYVRDAAVIGAPGRAGDAVVAVLVPMRGTNPTAGDLDEFVAGRLPIFKRPQAYQLVERLPRNEIGRIDRAAVRLQYAKFRAERQSDSAGSDEPTSPVTQVRANKASNVRSGPPGKVADPAVATPADGRPDPVPDSTADTTPERAAPLGELGNRLPRTGERGRRADDDTDDDLF